MTFHLFGSSLISFIMFYSLKYTSFSSLWFILKYFILFHAILNGAVSFIFFSERSPLVYRKQVIFVPGVLHPAALMNLLVLRAFAWKF